MCFIQMIVGLVSGMVTVTILTIYGFIMKLITQVDKNNDLLVSVQFQFPSTFLYPYKLRLFLQPVIKSWAVSSLFAVPRGRYIMVRLQLGHRRL